MSFPGIVIHREGDGCREEVEVHGRADRLYAEPGVDGHAGADVIRRVSISEQTFYRWKKVYGELGIGELRW